jgi:hypothetical protein
LEVEQIANILFSGGFGHGAQYVEAVGWRGDGDKFLDLGPTHQQLHRDPGTE